MEERISKSDGFLVEPLTRREYEVLTLMAASRSNREIGDHMTIAPTTVKWYTRQIYEKLGVHNRKQAVQRAITLGLIESGLPKHNIPSQPTPLIGREKELKAITQLILAQGCRLLTLVSPGGMGKTRLAIQVATDLVRQKLALFQDGIYFVALDALDDQAAIVPAIAEAVQFSFYNGNKDLRQQLLNYLRQKRCLLVLDNFEHLLDDQSASLTVDIVKISPGLRILVTSRTRLNVLDEQLFPVNGMEIPLDEIMREWSRTPKAALAYDSIQLFQQRAAQVLPGFEFTPENLAPIAQICKLVGGMPLGIELAAAWVEVLEPSAILAEIEAGPDFLGTEMHAIPERQRSIRVVFNTSWRLLDGDERQIIRKLSVFQGSFTRKAATQVGGVTSKSLLALVGKSWVQRTAPNRYLMHRLLRAYANQSLQEAPSQWQSARDGHAEYFCSELKQLEAGLRGGGQQEAILKIEQDIEDVQAAWRWATGTGRFDLLDQALFSLCTYYEWRGRYRDGEAMCRMAAEQMADAFNSGKVGIESNRHVWAKTLAWCAYFTQDYEAAGKLLEQSQGILDEIELVDNRLKEAQAAVWHFHGAHHSFHDRTHARWYFNQCRVLSREIGEQWREGRALQYLGWIAWTTGAADSARPLLEQSLTIQKLIGDRLGTSESLNILGLVARDKGNANKAQQFLLESLAICEELGARFKFANRLFLLAFSNINYGRFPEGLVQARLSLRIYNEIGYTGVWAGKPRIAIGAALMCMGQYSDARPEIEQSLKIAKENNNLQDIGMTLRYLGELALVEGSYAEAEQVITESLSILDEIKHSQYKSHLNLLGYAARYQGKMQLAYEYLLRSLEQVLQTHDELLIYEFIPLAALLAMDSGEIERAVELYALACQHPELCDNCWFEDLVGKHIAAVAASMAPGTVAAAQNRGKSLDIWETTEALVLALKPVQTAGW